ncbi:Pecanex-like protein 1 [Halotydeus destructor]|nr:Pecanex-like protein 1 [Halotydeus destructor]
MTSQALSILRQGIWASITGGWYYDPRQSHFANVFHFYAWLILLCLPLTIQVLIRDRFNEASKDHLLSASLLLWMGYCFITCILFIVIKLTNLYLHKLFDAGECIVEENGDPGSGNKVESDDINALPDLDKCSDSRRHDDAGSSRLEAIEMVELNTVVDKINEGVEGEEDDEEGDLVAERNTGREASEPEYLEVLIQKGESKDDVSPISVGKLKEKKVETGECSKIPIDVDVYAADATGTQWYSSSSSSASGASLAAPNAVSNPGRTQMSSRSLSVSRHVKEKKDHPFTNGLEKESSAPLLGAPDGFKVLKLEDAGNFESFQPETFVDKKWRSSSSSSSTSEVLPLSPINQPSTSRGQQFSRSCSTSMKAPKGGDVKTKSSLERISSVGHTSRVSVNFDPNTKFFKVDDGQDEKFPFDVYPASKGNGNNWSSSSSSSTSEMISLNAPANVLHTPSSHIQKSQSQSEGTYFGATSMNEPSGSFFARMIAANELTDDMYSHYLLSLQASARSTRSNHHSAFNNNLPDLSFSAIQYSFTSPELPPRPKQYFKLWLPPYLNWMYLKVRFDRLQLLALLDKNFTTTELCVSIFLGVVVAILGSAVLELKIFQDIQMFIFCFVMASCQYTLLKSVQPDAASPTHGYNRTIIYSRPVYFSITCTVILVCYCLKTWKTHFLDIDVYGIRLTSITNIEILMKGAEVFVLCFPIIFSLGLLPQINTFLMYFFEQVDIHVFGGTAATMGVTSAVYSICRSITISLLLYAMAVIALWKVYHSSSKLSEVTVYDYDVLFSIFTAILVSLAYHLSRSSSDMTVLWSLVTKCFSLSNKKPQKVSSKQDVEEIELKENAMETEILEEDNNEYVDPLPKKLEETISMRLQNDLIMCILISVVVFAVHVSSIFRLQPIVNNTLRLLAVIWGFILHYLIKQSRKELPWLCFAQPILKPKEYDLFEVKDSAKLMWFEWLHGWLWLIEKNVIYPLVFMSALTTDTPLILEKFGFYFGTAVIVICGLKCIRASFCDASFNYLVIIFSFLFFEFDLYAIREPFLLNYFILSFIFSKATELILKMKFVLTYVAPWQITWGSAFHAFAQPFSVPHSAMLFIQAGISAILSSPLQPVLGSAIFLVSYVRPIKFWERDYNTKRVDHSNIRLASQLDRNQLGTDDNNLNSIFYEHLTRSLQTSLYGDIALGRWGQVSQGDCYVLASDNLNCLVHIIELGNGLVTFQLRGLEFRGTYCQQREVEALSEGVSEDEACCCCEPGHLPSMLSMNAAFNQRWLAWEVMHTKYVLEGYSITDNSALSMLQPYEMRKALIMYYVKAVIYYTLTSKRLQRWLSNEVVKEALEPLASDSYVDLDPTFNATIDDDYDFRASGITMNSFYCMYYNWIRFCLEEHCNKRNRADYPEDEASVIRLCFALSLLARRALSVASHHNSFTSVEFLLYGLHALFKGDFRITSPRDEWVFQDIELLKQVIAPAVRMAVKLHQDHFMSTDEYDDNATLFAAISNYHKNIVISHEADPRWRNAVLSNVDSLLALRHVFDDGTDQYKIIMLNKRYLSFRLIKINRECVRGLWAGQQQELIYLRNRNPERGSIQNAKQALRNIINSSCDQPIGYPIYVSPLTTSFAETSSQLCRVIGHPFSFSMFRIAVLRFWTRVKVRCGEVSSGIHEDDPFSVKGSTSTIRNRQQRHQEVFMFDRNIGLRESRGSHSSDKSSEIESSFLLHRRQRGHSSHSHTASGSGNVQMYSRKLSSSRYHQPHASSSTLVNLQAFRSLSNADSRPTPLAPGVVAINPETVSVSFRPTASATQSTPPIVQAAQVATSSTVDLTTGSFGTSINKSKSDHV